MSNCFANSQPRISRFFLDHTWIIRTIFFHNFLTSFIFAALFKPHFLPGPYEEAQPIWCLLGRNSTANNQIARNCEKAVDDKLFAIAKISLHQPWTPLYMKKYMHQHRCCSFQTVSNWDSYFLYYCCQIQYIYQSSKL